MNFKHLQRDTEESVLQCFIHIAYVFMKSKKTEYRRKNVYSGTFFVKIAREFEVYSISLEAENIRHIEIKF
jgi:hypothetical protein